MNNSDEIIDQALRILRSKSPDGYEIYLEESSHFEVESKEGKVDSLEASRSWGMGLRILNRGRIGFSYTTSPAGLSERGATEGLQQTIEDAMASAEATSPDPCFDFAPAAKAPLLALPIFDKTLSTVSEKSKIEKVKLLEETVRSVDPERIGKVRKASYQEVISRSTLVNSNGLHSFYDMTLASASVMAVAEEAGESEMGWDFDFSHFIDDLDVIKVGRAAGIKALEKLGGRRVSSGTYPVLLDNRVASEFLSLLAHSFLAEQIQKGKSALKDRIGEAFFSPSVSIIDDGLLPEGASTSPFDGEGMPGQRTPLVVRGEIKGYLYDRFWARRENVRSGREGAVSTGNSRRHSVKAPPGLGTSNLFVEPGNSTLTSLIKSLDEGLIIEEVMGIHTVDPISGDFSLGCSGTWVEGGQKVFPVKSVAVAGTLFELFKKVMGVGDHVRFFGKIGSPELLIDKLELSGN